MPIPDAMLWRSGLFLGLLLALGLAEAVRPGPNPPPRRRRRWPAHLGVIAVDTLLARVLVPAGAAGAAAWAQAQGVGLLPALGLPSWAVWAVGLAAFDLAIYLQHRALHAVAWLWPLHRMHHTDVTLDATSALRFHPLEMLLSLAWKAAVAVALGVPPALVLAFEALLSSFALMTHANLALPPRLDRALRWVFVTPAMHRVHHGTAPDEQCSNYGFHVSVWDRLFGSYVEAAREQPQRFGVIWIDAQRAGRFLSLLREPFRRER